MPSANTMFGSTPGATAPMSNYAQTASVPDTGASSIGVNFSLIDGTPMRVATGIIVLVAALAGFRWSGYKFNVTSG